jgi:hypothetical protein
MNRQSGKKRLPEYNGAISPLSELAQYRDYLPRRRGFSDLVDHAHDLFN